MKIAELVLTILSTRFNEQYSDSQGLGRNCKFKKKLNFRISFDSIYFFLIIKGLLETNNDSN